jgi:hypothetical protein
MIQFLLLQNRQGKTRLSKYYRPYTDDEKVKLEGEIHRLVTTRDPKFTNFVEARAARRRLCRRPRRRAPRRRAPSPARPPLTRRAPRRTSAPAAQFRSYKLIYRRYAGLFFTLCVDMNDNELLYFESIHLFVELLDQARAAAAAAAAARAPPCPPHARRHTPPAQPAGVHARRRSPPSRHRAVLRQRLRARPRLQL